MFHKPKTRWTLHTNVFDNPYERIGQSQQRHNATKTRILAAYTKEKPSLLRCYCSVLVSSNCYHSLSHAISFQFVPSLPYVAFAHAKDRLRGRPRRVIKYCFSFPMETVDTYSATKCPCLLNHCYDGYVKPSDQVSYVYENILPLSINVVSIILPSSFVVLLKLLSLCIITSGGQ